MFYSGSKTFLMTFSIIFFFFKFFHNLILYKLLKQFNNISFNDSIEFLCIISSSIYTLLFLIIMIICIYINYVRRIPNKMWFVVILYSYFLNFSFVDNILCHIFKTININLNLQNGLLNIHPYIIYILYSWIIIYIYNSLFKQKCFLTVFRNRTNLILLNSLLFFGILLGAWWASQELNWGGFWSWDPVELISLLLFMYVVSILHKSNNVYISNKVYIYTVLVVTIIYFIMRLGIISTVHSFIKNLNMPFYTCILCIGIISILSKKYFKDIYTIRTTFVFYITNTNITIILIQTLLTLIISALFLLICSNLNLLSNIFILPLNFMFIFLFHTFLILYFLKNIKLSYKIQIFLSILFVITLNVNYIFMLWVFTVINMNIKNMKLLHFLFLWGYMIYTYFFTSILQYTHIDTLNSIQITLTDYYTNKGLLNYYENNQFFKKNYYLLTYKINLYHILSFKTTSNNILTYFIIGKNNNTRIIYSEEFTMLVVYISMLFIFYFNKKFYTNTTIFY